MLIYIKNLLKEYQIFNDIKNTLNCWKMLLYYKVKSIYGVNYV